MKPIDQPVRFPCKKLVLAVTGSVGAAAVIPDFILLIRKVFAQEITVVLSEASQQFLSSYAVELYAGSPPIASLFSCHPLRVPHVEATKDADVMLIMPATANTIAKLAVGIADDVVSATALAATCPIICVPNMNEAMWTKPVVTEHIEQLRKWGMHILDPVVGTEIATLTSTRGAMPSPTAVLKFTLRVLLSERRRRLHTSDGSSTRVQRRP